MVEGGGQTVDIAAHIRVARVAPVLLQRGVGHRPPTLHHGHRAGILGIEQLDQTKIHQLDDPLGRQLDIAGLDIPMQYRRILAVQIVQGIQDLGRPRQYLALCQKAVLTPGIGQHLLQISSGHIVHDQIFPAAVGKIVRYLGQIGVVQPGQHTGLLVELVHRFGQHLGRTVDPQQIGQHLLDGANPAVQAQIVGLIDGAHAALAHQFQDLIAFPQDNPRIQHVRHAHVPLFMKMQSWQFLV